jgi:putative endonuclease
MAYKQSLGSWGEKYISQHLEKLGWKILENNFRTKFGEIDIIAQKDSTLAVIEVKTRSSIAFGLPQDFVKPKKIQLLVKAVNEYIVSNDLDVDVRFDIIAIYKEENTYKIEHFEDAFYHF